LLGQIDVIIFENRSVRLVLGSSFLVLLVVGVCDVGVELNAVGVSVVEADFAPLLGRYFIFCG
jgi:hypothetical protein